MRKKDQLEWVAPMLATLTDKRFSDEEWLYEAKFDGVRCVCVREGREVALYSRNHLSMNETYPEIVEAMRKQKPRSFVVDGEIVAFSHGLTSFGELQRRMKTRRPSPALVEAVPVFYYLFDLMALGGQDLTARPLVERKRLLEERFSFTGPIRYSTHRLKEGEALFRQACRQRWEGLIAKRAESPYVSTRSRDWLKFKCSLRQEFVIGGYTDSTNPGNPFGALLLGYFQDGKFRYAGKVGTGFDQRTFEDLKKRLYAIETSEPPFGTPVREKGVHWVKPKVIGEVAFTEWTADGKLRHPSFLGWRVDKDPREIGREYPS